MEVGLNSRVAQLGKWYYCLVGRTWDFESTRLVNLCRYPKARVRIPVVPSCARMAEWLRRQA